MAFEISELIQSGSLPKGWSVCKVGDVADVNSASISKRSPPDEIAYLDISSVSTRSYEKPKRMKFADAPSRAQRIVKTGDTLIATVRPNLRAFLYIARPENNLIASTGFACVTPKKSGDSLFLHYFLTCEPFIEYLVRLADGAAYPAFDYKLIPLAEMPLPPVSEREEIGAFLGALDDRITLLRETNATLEAIAQAIFKSWFVDFDPVRAKQEGRAPEGMDDATAALFPDSFEESELGLVPMGWRVGSLENLAALNSESWTAKKHPDTVLYIDLANAKDNQIAEVTSYAFDEAPSRARRVLRDGDTIVGTVRPGNRSFAFIHQAASNLTASTGFAVLRPREIENTEFIYLAATQDSSIEHLAHVADGGAYPAVRPEVVASIQTILPNVEAMAAFHEVAAPLLASVAYNQQQAQTLATLRDTLLPRLISGQLRLPDADAVNEESHVADA